MREFAVVSNMCAFYSPMTINRPDTHHTCGFKGPMNMNAVEMARRVQKVSINLREDRPWSAKDEVPNETTIVHQTATTLIKSAYEVGSIPWMNPNGTTHLSPGGMFASSAGQGIDLFEER